MALHRTALLAAVLFPLASACSDYASTPTEPDRDSRPDAELAPLHRSAGTAVPGSYIVVLKNSATPAAVAFAAGIQPQFNFAPQSGSEAGTAGASGDDISGAPLVNGFAARLSADELLALRQDPNVSYVEEDQVITADETQYMTDNKYGDPWGLDRLDQRSLSLSKSYSYSSKGYGVYVYVIDSGLQTNHPEFESRARNVYDVFGGNGSDCHGHGTKVAGIIGAKKWGVAKKAYLQGVKVLDCYGKGTTSGFIKALNWVRYNRKNPAVVNMSLSSSYSSTVNDAVAKLISSGVFVSVSAGNNSADACKYSPGSASGAFTTAASKESDYRVSYSNYGKCVDAYAPGYNIMTSAKGSSTALVSGTSMAAPHVAGVAALYRSKYTSASPSTVTSWIKNNATSSKIKSNPSGTPNLLLYKSSL